MSKDLVNEIASRQLKSNIPDFKSGDTVKVSVRITENNKSRIQVFQGV
ncbi:MAG: 50S ribosomal protein L19, partial [Bacilli bacterium]|nr:50S ribosomal protein L19 [Bacilli bacterium]